ncbi:MAG: nucleoside triphosphate pyrophosphohydrolase [Oscillospiraceae bacterium]|nr:nucleoside triphosphate pyrophosphohydrolase [Oscillospiraceae bacterium]
MVDFESKPNYGVEDLRKLLHLLCSPEGCPWDSAQTHQSIRRNLLEEAYEAAEAIDSGDMAHLQEELGDVLMQVVFHSDMAERAGYFNLDDVADETCKKLVRRHPHVFGGQKANNSDESLVFWDQIKREEKSQNTVSETLESVAKSLPGLWRAEKIQKKAADAGFNVENASGALSSLREEFSELEAAISAGAGISEEIGDLIFSIVNVARFFDIDPETAVAKSCDKFTSRFKRLEALAFSQGKRIEDMSAADTDKLYRRAKSEG